MKNVAILLAVILVARSAPSGRCRGNTVLTTLAFSSPKTNVLQPSKCWKVGRGSGRFDRGRFPTTILSPLTMSSNENNDESSSNGSYNPIDQETPEERESRMKLVRRLQKSFYQDEEGPTVDAAEPESESTNTDTTLIRNLPLWRVQWTELPGSQNVLNVHVPHYTNMFQKILRGQSRDWYEDSSADTAGIEPSGDRPYYFGHIFLPGGSENLDNPDYALKVGDTGTLLRISDSRQQPDDGRLTLVVQALERFEITRVERSHSPYAVADVRILPDAEQVAQARKDQENADGGGTPDEKNQSSDDARDEAALAQAVKEALANHPFEFRRVSIDECEAMSIDGTVVGVSVSPISNYDATVLPSGTHGGGTPTVTDHGRVAVAESDVWCSVNNLLRLLNLATRGAGVPVPSQILGLLPRSRSVWNAGTNRAELVPWPEDFVLERTIEAIERRSSSTTMVGTHSKSPFVRVDNDSNNNDSSFYSPLRRAQRLSYVLWTLTDSINVDAGGTDGRFGREAILGIRSTRERLELATEKIQAVCSTLKEMLGMEK